jgi:hypothetical protein
MGLGLECYLCQNTNIGHKVYLWCHKPLWIELQKLIFGFLNIEIYEIMKQNT